MQRTHRRNSRQRAGAPSKWNHPPSVAIRVPKCFTSQILQFARKLDSNEDEIESLQTQTDTSSLKNIDKLQYIEYYQNIVPKVSPAEVFKALGDEHRLKIIEYLASSQSCCEPSDGICACDIQDLVGLSQATVSHHMKILVQAELAISEKRGRLVYYRINPEGFAIALELARRYFDFALLPKPFQQEVRG
jgi:ArsR family transcriptional regulator